MILENTDGIETLIDVTKGLDQYQDLFDIYSN
jgi:hypothetical protein